MVGDVEALWKPTFTSALPQLPHTLATRLKVCPAKDTAKDDQDKKAGHEEEDDLLDASMAGIDSQVQQEAEKLSEARDYCEEHEDIVKLSEEQVRQIRYMAAQYTLSTM
ncbi:hypothetical protein BGZ65_001940 [Modicella reniformis]|uniref:Uncharacterized protein n=1 Tax=Modicella reniformis TaxID=1440133 RepID=A0A9P6MIE6_9FUNG|nr:hypothetical protein BGZ65_001940 [Modicella reniformis]